MLKKGKAIILLLILMSFVMSGCINKEPEQKMYDALEKVVAAEQVFKEQQDPLVQIEQQEKKIYDEIISLSMKEFDKIKKLSNEAIDLVEQRKAHMEKERESIEQSKQEFEKTEDIINSFDDSTLKKTAEDLYGIMIERYDVHDELYTNYIASIELDKELYELFKQEDVTIEQLEAQIAKINDSYEKVLNDNEQFNVKTEEYNEAKLNFYKEAGIDVK
ncbi:YkyA family protein [Cytobacillus horneckiae]|uniref:YkyA family protein n=1 Tax=Cytobacillus horneckiae TaxID=549687 RepID=UPI0039A31E17